MTAYSDRSRLHSHARLAALEQTGLLDSEPEKGFDRITAMAAKLLKSRVALLSLVTDQRQFFKSECGLGELAPGVRETPLSHSFCKHVIESGEPLIIDDARHVSFLAENPAIKEIGVIAYLGIPVRDPRGEVLGSLCAIGDQPRTWSPEDIETMQDLAEIAEDEIELREHARRAQSLADGNAVLAKEYHHRVKNALAVSAALLKLSGKDATSIDDLVVKAGARLNALAGAHDSLIAQSDDVDLGSLARRLLLPYCPPSTSADAEGPAVNLRHWQVTPICLFLHELATNSAKYGAFRAFGRVSVRWTISPTNVVMLDWNEELTDSSQKAPAGFGSKLLQTSASQLSGECSTSWSEDGLFVTLTFPLAPRRAGERAPAGGTQPTSA